MTIVTDVYEGLTALCDSIGPDATSNVMLMCGTYHRKGELSVGLEPKGYNGKVRLSAQVGSLEEVVPAITAEWEKHKELHAANTIKSMAIAIIRLTTELGECTDASLRCEFAAMEIDEYGNAAADLATEMGGRGPFRIVRLTGANDVGQAEEAA